MNLAPNKSTYVNGVPDHFTISYIATCIAELPMQKREDIILVLLNAEVAHVSPCDVQAIISDCVVEYGSDEIRDAHETHCIDNDAECRDDFVYEEDGSGNP